MVVIDPKGENAWITAQRRREMGQRVVILDPWNEVNRRYAGGQEVEKVTQFNPLSAIKPDDLDFADEVVALANALIVKGDDAQSSHWDDSARELVAGLIAVAVEQHPGTASLGEVRNLLTMADDDLRDRIAMVRETRPDSLGARKLRRFTRDSNEIGSIRSTAETQTALLDNARLIAAMETDATPFDIAELGELPVTIYLVLPIDRLASHGRWLRLILTLAIRAVARRATPPWQPVLFMVDEMGTIGRLEIIEQAFGLMAGIGIRLWGFLQDLNQLQRDYPKSWETFIANTSVLQLLSVRDVNTSKYFSDLMGTFQISYTSQSGSKGSMFKDLGPPGGSSWSNQIASRAIALPQELRQYAGEIVILIISNQIIYEQKKLVYYSEKFLDGFYRPHPLFQKPTVSPEPVAKKSFFSRR